MRDRTISTVAAILTIAAAGVLAAVAPAAPAAAAACSSATGITVVVDFNELGGGVTAGCDRDGAGRDATEVFQDAGYPLTFVQDDPGFVCRVSGQPADNPCVRTPPASAYWSLWWSDGTSGRWVYSSSGVGSLEVPDGGYVAFAWHQGDGRAAPPDATPTAHTDPAPPSDDPGGGQGDGGGSGSGGGNGSDGDGPGGGSGDDAGAFEGGPTASAAPTSAATSSATPGGPSESGSPDGRRQRDRGTTSSAAASPTSSSAVPGAAEITAGPPAADLATEPSEDGGGAMTTWVALGLAALVLGAAGVLTVFRRRVE